MHFIYCQKFYPPPPNISCNFFQKAVRNLGLKKVSPPPSVSATFIFDDVKQSFKRCSFHGYCTVKQLFIELYNPNLNLAPDLKKMICVMKYFFVCFNISCFYFIKGLLGHQAQVRLFHGSSAAAAKKVMTHILTVLMKYYHFFSIVHR